MNLLVVLALGSLFIAGQAYEWSQLFGRGSGWIVRLGRRFLLSPAFTALHVLIGLAWASVVLFFGLGNAYNSNDHHAIEFFGLYWHFVDIVWIVLFSLIYLL